MNKREAERAIKALCHEWQEACFPGVPNDKLHFSNFHLWLREHHPNVLKFRSAMGAMDDAERWFDGEFRQSWRN